MSTSTNYRPGDLVTVANPEHPGSRLYNGNHRVLAIEGDEAMILSDGLPVEYAIRVERKLLRAPVVRKMKNRDPA